MYLPNDFVSTSRRPAFLFYLDKDDGKKEQETPSNERDDDVTVKGPKPFDPVSYGMKCIVSKVIYMYAYCFHLILLLFFTFQAFTNYMR